VREAIVCESQVRGDARIDLSARSACPRFRKPSREIRSLGAAAMEPVQAPHAPRYGVPRFARFAVRCIRQPANKESPVGIFSAIMDKIFHHPIAASATPPQPAAEQPMAAAASPSVAASAPAAQSVDVEAVLAHLASERGGGGNWRTSIVDLLKLLDLDPGLAARKQLAGELNIHAAGDGTAEENMALQKAVMQKLAENGGKVPDSLKT
jgi:hypothetical protein